MKTAQFGIPPLALNWHTSGLIRVVRESSPLTSRMIPAVGFAALALVLQGCVTSQPVQSIAVYEDRKAPTASHAISIGTFNLEGLSHPEGLALSLRALTNVEVWAFQEMIVQEVECGPMVPLKESTPPEQLRKILPGGPWHIYCVPVNPVGQGAWEGQAIASRYPLGKLCVWNLRSKGESKGKKRRAAIVCDVLTPSGNICLVNTDHEVGITTTGPADRQLQVDDLLANIRQNSSTNPVVLLGDFNTNGKPLQFWRKTSRTEIRHLQESVRAASLEHLPECDVPYKTCRVLCLSYALDHIFLRNANCCCWGSALPRRGSDHQPLWATIRLNP